MDIRTFKKSLPYLFQAGVTPMVWGFHGIGKSEVFQQIADGLGYKLFNLRLGQLSDAGDLLGLGDLRKDPKTGETISTKFFVPNWLREAVDYCNNNPKSGYIIFLDEINRAARKDILQACFQLVLDKRLHECKLPPNCYVVAAANPDTEDYSVLTFDDKAFISRFCHISLKPTKREWVEFAKEQEYDKDIVNFILEQEGCLETELQAFDIEKVVKPCRRSWTHVNKLKQVNPPMEVFRPLMQGMVGLESTVAFMKFLENDDKPLTAEQILKEYTKKHKEKIKKLANPEKCRLDVLKASCENLEHYFDKNEDKLKKSEQGNFLDFLKDIPVELVYSTMTKLYHKEHLSDLVTNDRPLIEIMAKAKGKTWEQLDKEEQEMKAKTE